MEDSIFEKLVLENERKLYRISMSMLKNEADAQDAVHDAILKAYEKSHTLKNDELFSTWLVRILINCCNKQLRQKKRNNNDIFSIADVASRNNPYLDIEVGELLDSLPEKIRSVVILYYIEGYSVKEIKKILKVPEGTVKSRLSRGRKMLKE